MAKHPTSNVDPDPSRRRMLRGVVRVVLALGLLIAVAGAGGVLWGMGRDIHAPDWMRVRIEDRLKEVAPNAQVRFGEVVMVVDEGWRPRVRVADVQVATLSGEEIVAFSEVRASMAMRPLLAGRLDLKSLDVSGVFATLRRAADGRITLIGGPNAGLPSREAANVAELVADLDKLLLQPGLEALTRGTVRALTLRYEDEMAGRAWTADGGRMTLTRTGEDLRLTADLAVLGGGAQAATIAANYTGRIGETAAQFGVTIADVDGADIATQGAAFAWLGVLHAPISGALRGAVDAQGQLLPLNATLQIAAGVIQPTPNARPVPIESARSYFSFDPDRQVLRFDELSVDSKWIAARLEGDVQLNSTPERGLSNLVGQVQLSDLVLDPPGFYEAPINVAAAEMDFRLQLDPFELTVGRLQIEDMGHTLTARGSTGADERGWKTTVDADLDTITPERLIALWPATVGAKTRTWLSKNLVAGKLSDIAFALRRTPNQPQDIYLSFGFEDTEVKFMRTMPVIKGAQGQATMLRHRFVLSVDKGTVEAPAGGMVEMSGSSFIIPDVRVKEQTPALVRLRTGSSVTAALALLNQPPMEVMDKANLPVDLAEGRAALEGTLAFPLLKPGQKPPVDFYVTGQISGVTTDRLVKGRTLTSDLLSLSAENSEVVITGEGRLDGVPFNGSWRQPIGPKADGTSRVRTKIELSQQALDAFAINLPPGSISGVGDADLAIDLVQGQAPAFSVKSSLEDVAINVQPVAWSKPRGVAGALEITGRLGDAPQIDSLSLRGPGLSARGGLVLSPGGQFERAELNRVTVGGWFDAPVDILSRGTGVPVGVVLRGGSVDLRKATFAEPSGGGSGNAGSPMTIALDRVQITDTIALTDMRGNFTTGGGMSGAFTAKVNGGAQINGRIVPQNGRSAFQLSSADAGQVFASAGLLDQARGGVMDLTLTPVGTGGAFDGRLLVQKTRITDAPVMAALLNAISIVGLLDELGGDGIVFSEVRAAFRLSPDQITLTEASATGPSMGISMDGVFRTDTKQLALRGVISPVYLLNGLGSFLTRRGEGVIGFNYAVSGNADAPKVSVNPLSALAPGVFRELFRAPPPEVPQAEGEVAPEPDPEPAPKTPTLRNPPLVDDDIGR